MENAACYAPQILVSTEDLPREQWLEYRRKGIGGSDAAAVLGISPFRTGRDLYYDKLNSGHPLPAVFHTSFLTLSHTPSASAFGMIVISNRYNGLPAPQQIASPAEIVPFSIPTVQSSDNGYNIYLDFGHERQEMPCASRVRSTFRTKYSM